MVSDAMVEKPIRFTVTYTETVTPPAGGMLRKIRARLGMKAKAREVEKTRPFVINPPCLGKMQLLSKCYLALDIDDKALGKNPETETMRICEEKTDAVCDLMAVAVQNSREDMLDDAKIRADSDFFRWHSSPADFSTVVMAILTQIDYVNFINSIRLTKILRQNKPREKQGAGRIEGQSGDAPCGGR